MRRSPFGGFQYLISLIREIHQELMKGVRGAERSPGEFRRSQNWIGAGESILATATYIPPPLYEMLQSLDNLEKFLPSVTFSTF
jgi:Fic family protein